jgi:two-component system, NarL family, nitrate/nitrite response regulator NarL
MEATPTIKVLLADDHQMFLDCLKRVLEDESNMEIVGMALDGTEVLDALSRLQVDVLVLDYQMPRMNGLETLRELSGAYPDVKTVVLSFSNEGKTIHEMIRAGAKGYIVKNRGAVDLVEAITAVASGKRFFPSEVGAALSEFLADGETSSPAPEPQFEHDASLKLSSRETDVIACMLDGMSAKLIADALNIAKPTVETHKQKIMRRFGFHNGNQIVSLAKDRGIVAWSQRPPKNK